MAGLELWPPPESASTVPIITGAIFFAAEIQAFKDEIRKAYAIAPDGVIGVNCMVAVTNYDDMVRAACEAGAKFIVSGAGLPMSLPSLTVDYPDVALIPIVSSVRAAQLIGRKWSQTYGRLPDAVVVEDPDTAGGHLGEKPENIGIGCYDQYETVRQVKEHFQQVHQINMPVIAAGGVWDRKDVLHALAQGADAVQMASRFVCTEECDADPAFKQAYLDCRPEDIGLIMSPAGLPGRALFAILSMFGSATWMSGSVAGVLALKNAPTRKPASDSALSALWTGRSGVTLTQDWFSVEPTPGRLTALPRFRPSLTNCSPSPIRSVDLWRSMADRPK